MCKPKDDVLDVARRHGFPLTTSTPPHQKGRRDKFDWADVHITLLSPISYTSGAALFNAGKKKEKKRAKATVV
jgi:hypothetical protein